MIRRERRSKTCVGSDITIRSICAPRSLICVLRALVVKLNAHRTIELVRLRVLRIGRTERRVLIKRILCTNRPDICTVFRIARNIVEARCLKYFTVEVAIRNSAPDEFAALVAQLNALIVGRFVRCSVDSFVCMCKIPTACLDQHLKLVAVGCLYTREEVIHNEAVIHVRVERHLAELHVEPAITAVGIGIGQSDVSALVRLHIAADCQTSLDLPVVIDLSCREETQLELISVCLFLSAGRVAILIAEAPITITEFARPLDHICIALEVRDADAEVVEFIRKLSSEAVNKCTIRCRQIALRHCACNHLRHLIARHVAVAAERAAAVALDNAIGSELRHSIVCPVVTGHIRERICRSEGRGCCTDCQCYCKSSCHRLLHRSSSFAGISRCQINA